MINDERFLDSPTLPQYGQLRAMCYASMPTSFNAFFLMIGLGIGFVVLAIVAGFVQQLDVDELTRGKISACVLVVLIVAMWFGIRKMCRKYNKQALFVYDGGIHINEDISYVVNYGNWWQFCTGRRAVSIPWRVMKDFKARELKRKNQVEASVKLPDGRTLTLNTADGEQSGSAIATMMDHLAN